MKHMITGPLLENIAMSVATTIAANPTVHIRGKNIVYFTELLAETVTETPVRLSDVWNEHGKQYGDHLLGDWLSYAAVCKRLQVIDNVFVRVKTPLGIYNRQSMRKCLKNRGLMCTSSTQIVKEYPDAAKDLSAMCTSKEVIYLTSTDVIHTDALGGFRHIRGARKKWRKYRKTHRLL